MLEKPYPTFPLTPHTSGRGWAKKYKGKQLFIAEKDPAKALKKFHRIAARIDAGKFDQGKAKVMDEATVYDVTNRYVSERREDRDAGRLSEGSWRDYRDAANAMCDEFGEETLVEALTPDDFSRFYRNAAKRLGAHALARLIQCCRTIWKHAEDNDWIARRPKYGSVFRKPLAGKKQGKGFTIEEARVLIACAVGSQLEAMLLLMLNGGFTAKDCAALPREAVDFNMGIIRFPRPKMKHRRPVDRVMTLWPETAEALADVMKDRDGDEFVFRTSHGNLWVTGQTDSIALMFGRILDDLGWNIEGEDGRDISRGPSWMRHLHRTLADELEKPNAAARLMGHRLAGLAEVYVDRIEHARLQELTDHIRHRLWPDAQAHPPQQV